MAEETWHVARLIPTSGIVGPDEQERRATSALLAVMAAVREFGRAASSGSASKRSELRAGGLRWAVQVLRRLGGW